MNIENIFLFVRKKYNCFVVVSNVVSTILLFTVFSMITPRVYSCVFTISWLLLLVQLIVCAAFSLPFNSSTCSYIDRGTSMRSSN